MYSARYEQGVEKDLHYLPKEVIRRLLDRIESVLGLNPLAGKKLEYRGRELYSYRVRDYRVIYAIDARKKEITIYRIRHRKEVYRLRPFRAIWPKNHFTLQPLPIVSVLPFVNRQS
jgi:mRNA interferase RelE/StbE